MIGPKALAPRLAGSRKRDFQRLMAEVERYYAPSEVLALADAVSAEGGPNAERLAKHPLVEHLRAVGPRPFTRHRWSDGARLYSGGSDPRQKILLVGFTGRSAKMMLHTPALLQCLDPSRVDLLLLADPTRNHYRHGCPGLGATFAELARSVERYAEERQYAACKAFGTSMGGLVAIRFGIMARCDLALSIGGRPPFDVNRLFARKPLPSAFDPLCACMAHRAGACRFAYSQGNAEDRKWGRFYASLVGGRTVEVAGTKDHGLLWDLWQDRSCEGFLSTALDLDSGNLENSESLPRMHVTWTARLRRAFWKVREWYSAGGLRGVARNASRRSHGRARLHGLATRLLRADRRMDR